MKKPEKIRIMVGGICPCGGKLKYATWNTSKMIKERVTCQSCGRTENSTMMKSEEIIPW